jgi:nucleotide-binding universal stress UspA family protein
MDAGTDTNTPEDRSARGGGGTDTPRRRVVVGVDGSPGSRGALVHAMTLAAQHQAHLEVVAAYPETLVWTGGYPLDVPDMTAVRDDAEARTSAFVAEVRDDPAVRDLPGIAGLDVRVVASGGRAAAVLLERAEGADLLVVGSRGRGAMRSALLGSVALHCVSNPPCPVVVVRPHPVEAVAGGAHRVVVGVDGSAASQVALAAAVEEAANRGADLDVVAAYVLTDYWVDLGSVALPTVEQIRTDLQHRIDELVEQTLAARAADGRTAAPEIQTELVEGAAAEVLVERARGAELLVVGSHGRGAIRGLLLGSVALHCAMHAPGPVMVVHPRRSRSTVTTAQPEPALADR